MKSNREIRQEAWHAMVHENAFGRAWILSLVLGGILVLVIGGIEIAFRVFDVETLANFQRAQVEAAQSGLGFTSPSSTATLRMYSATLGQNFIQYIFSGIWMLGFAVFSLKAIRHQPEHWFRASLVGFSIPLGVFWLWFCIQIRTALWLLVTLALTMPFAGLAVKMFALPIPVASVIVAIPTALVLFWVVYRYRQVWFIKADNMEKSAGACIRESVEMMKGYKYRAVGLDCSYWPWFALILIPVTGIASLFCCSYTADMMNAYVILALVLVGIVAFFLAVFVGLYILLGQAVFYEQLKAVENTDIA